MIFTEEFNECCKLLPSKYRRALEHYFTAEEIRLRCGHKLSVVIGGEEKEIADHIITEEDLLHVIDVASGASLHSAAEFISSGFLSYRGIRVGVCGQAIYSDSKAKGYKKFNSVAIRIPHNLNDMIPKSIVNELISSPSNTLIIAGPGLGKTSALRELVFLFSENGHRVSLIDERGEFTSQCMVARLGKCTDIISFMPKSEAASIMLRAMNPHIIAMDEISKAEDIETIYDVIGCGTIVFATAHAANFSEMGKRPGYRNLINEKIFENILTISLFGKERKYVLERIMT